MPSPRHLGGRRLLLASLTGSERRGARGGETPSKTPGLVPSPRHLGGRRLLLASLTGSEWRGARGGETPSKMPGLVPSPRHPGGRRLLLASLTGSERRGNSVKDSRPRAVAPSSRRMSSPARIPDWEREEGRLRPWRPASCRRRVVPADVVSCSHP